MKTMYAFKTVEDMANGNYLATGSAKDSGFGNQIARYWSECGYYVTIHCTVSSHIKVVEPTLTIVNKPSKLKVFRVSGDYALAVVAAPDEDAARKLACTYEDGEDKGYPWEDAAVYEDADTDYIVGKGDEAYLIGEYQE